MALFIPDRGAHGFARNFKSVLGLRGSHSRGSEDDLKSPHAIRLTHPEAAGTRRYSRPLADPEVMASRIYLARGPCRGGDLVFAQLPPLPLLTLPAFSDAFHTKLKQCSIRCRWQHPSADLHAKEIKTNDLLEILKICEIPNSFRRLSQASWTGLLDMIVANIYRHVLPLTPTLQMSEELPTFHDPEWPHLALVYNILRRAHTIAPEMLGLTVPFFKKLLNQIGSPDGREKDQICGFAADFVIGRQRQLAELLDALAAAGLIWHGTANSVFAVHAIVTIYGSVLRVVGPSSAPMKRFFYATVLPQLTSISFIAFARPFVTVVQTFIGFHGSGSVDVLRHIAEYWPLMRSAKQVVFLRLFVIAVQCATEPCKLVIVQRLFPIVAECIASPVMRVAEAALQLLGDPTVDGIVQENAAVLVPMLMAAARHANRNHWAPDIRDMAQATMVILSGIESRMAVKEEVPVRPESPPGHVWARILHTAHRADETVNVGKTLSQLMAVYGTAKLNHTAARRRSAAAAPTLPM
jgi:serine/threonine-protein phosphatase 2A regulatory subunit B'